MVDEHVHPLGESGDRRIVGVFRLQLVRRRLPGGRDDNIERPGFGELDVVDHGSQLPRTASLTKTRL